MNFLNNLKVRDKLLLMLAIPIIGLLFYSLGNIVDQSDTANEMDALMELAQFSVTSSALIHETQKERGMTAGFLGSKGTKFVNEIQAQRKLTDNRLNDLKALLDDFETNQYGQIFSSSVNNANGLLSQLNQKRSAVSSQNITAKDAIGFYTNINSNLLNAISQMATNSSDAQMTATASAYHNFLMSKERAGIERAVLSNTFAQDKFGSGMYKKFIALVTEQNTYMNSFLMTASDEHKNFYKTTMQHPDIKEVENLRESAFANAIEGGFGIDASYWFKTITGKINLLKEVENKLSIDLAVNAETLGTSASRAKLISIISTTIAMLVTFFLAFYIIGRIVKPVNKTIELTDQLNAGFADFSQILNAMAANDLSREVTQERPPTVGLKSNDEIGKLIDTLERTFESKYAIGASLKRMRSNLRSMVEKLSDNSRELVSAATEISSSSTEMAKGADMQAQQVTQVSAAVEEMSATIVESAKNAGEASDASSNAAQTATGGGQIVSDTIKGLQQIADVVSQSSNSISELAESADQIGEIISVIDDIADQTNLLALNAAIEAARAGEQGRGFAVVADEVRKLAERTGKATSEITGMIKGIQNGTEKSVYAMEAGVQEVDKGKALADKAGDSLNQVITLSQHVGDMISQIATASEEQSVAAEEISKNIEHISSVTKETASGAEQMATAADELNKQAELLQQMVAQFKL